MKRIIKREARFPWAESESESIKVVVEKTHKWEKVKWTPMTEEMRGGLGRKGKNAHKSPMGVILKKPGSQQNGVQVLLPINYSALDKLLNLPMLFLVYK